MHRMEGNDGEDPNRRPRWSDLPTVVPYEPTVPQKPERPTIAPPDTVTPAPESDPATREVETWVNHFRRQAHKSSAPN